MKTKHSARNVASLCKKIQKLVEDTPSWDLRSNDLYYQAVAIDERCMAGEWGGKRTDAFRDAHGVVEKALQVRAKVLLRKLLKDHGVTSADFQRFVQSSRKAESEGYLDCLDLFQVAS